MLCRPRTPGPPRPRRCPQCLGYRIWGHGYVSRYFDGESTSLPMKRWRCADCRAVHTMRPHTHWRGFLASTSVILSSVKLKETADRWLRQIGRERQQYWWRGFQKQRRFDGSSQSLAALISRRIIAATHSLTHREITVYEHPPYRIFAFTPSPRGP